MNNNISVTGLVNSNLEFSHEVYDEKFYKFQIKVDRLSASADILPVTVSEKIIDKEQLQIGKLINVTGQLRSYNNFNSDETKTKLILTIFAKNINIEPASDVINEVNLIGYICKPTVYRTTPFGREITDLLLAVNRAHSKSDYIPCIAWGRNAKFAEGLNVGDNIEISGRMQSREYQKTLLNGDVVNKMAYELSISKIELHTENEIS